MHRSTLAVGLSLSGLVEQSTTLKQIKKSDLLSGDSVYIKTQNSLYVVQATGHNSYTVSGGWFDRKGLSPVAITINGCTWGGSAIKIDIVAACGLCLEFGNRVRTSAIQKIFVLPNVIRN